MNELPLVFGAIGATVAVMVWMLLVFRGFFRLREERAPEVVFAKVETPAPKAPAKPARPAPAAAQRRGGLAA